MFFRERKYVFCLRKTIIKERKYVFCRRKTINKERKTGEISFFVSTNWISPPTHLQKQGG